MIKFFRKIRQQLLSENKFTRYLLYAVGEIVLVVIGILIALNINNWNQESKDYRAGEALLERIHIDLVQDTINFRNSIDQNILLREEIKEALVVLYKGVDNLDQVDFITTVYDKALDQVFSPNDNTYKAIISSGTLRLIQNPELKDEIVDLYSDYESVKTLLNSINDWMGGVAIAVDTETDFIKFNHLVSDIYTTPEMLNENDYAFLNNKEDKRFKIIVRAFSATAFNQKVRNAYYAEYITKCDKVLRHIDAELKKDN